MEPRPPKRPSGSAPAASPAEPQPERAHWLDRSPAPSVSSGSSGNAGAPTGDLSSTRLRLPWQSAPAPSLGGSLPGDGAPRTPLMPVVAPRGERGGRYLGPILAALLLAVIIAGVAFAISRARDEDRPSAASDATRVAGLASGSPTPEGTATGSPVAGNQSAAVIGTTPAGASVGTPVNGRVASEDPTPTRIPRQTSTPTASSGGSSLVRAKDVLPSVRQLPDGFVVSEEGAYSKDDIVSQLGENGEELLREWKWRENAYRSFLIPDDVAPDPDTTTFLIVSVHRFGGSAGAKEALDYLANVLAASGYEEAEVPAIGDQQRALTQSGDANIYVLYVRSGYYVIRIGGSSPAGDPSADVNALAEKLVAGLENR